MAAAFNVHEAPDAIFTSDTGMSTDWLSRFDTLDGNRRLFGSYNLGSMANAMPQALAAAALGRTRQVVAFCGDGGLTMLLGDLLTAVSYVLPVKLIVFNNGRLGMVKLEQEQVGLPEFDTVLHSRTCQTWHGPVVFGGSRRCHQCCPGPSQSHTGGHPHQLGGNIAAAEDHRAPGRGFAAAKIKETLGPPDRS